ncbi:hypothetical protein SCACP_13770 [Sporomusa carbonis]
MNKMKLIAGYCYALRNYLQTPKGRHDALDYIRGALIIIGVILSIRLVIK